MRPGGPDSPRQMPGSPNKKNKLSPQSGTCSQSASAIGLEGVLILDMCVGNAEQQNPLFSGLSMAQQQQLANQEALIVRRNLV
jgi:hypothetical protein